MHHGLKESGSISDTQLVAFEARGDSYCLKVYR